MQIMTDTVLKGMILQNPHLPIAVKGLHPDGAIIPSDDMIDQLVQAHREKGMVERADKIIDGQFLRRGGIANIDTQFANA